MAVSPDPAASRDEPKWLFRCAFEFVAPAADANTALETADRIESLLQELPGVTVNDEVLMCLCEIKDPAA